MVPHKKLKFGLSSSFLQVLLVPGQSGANGWGVTPLLRMARSSDFATATMLLRQLPVMATRLKRLPAQSLPIQVALTFKAESISFPGVDGEWQEWGEWSHCTASCGQGLKIRARACSEPEFGGNYECPGNGTEVEGCSSDECPGVLT